MKFDWARHEGKEEGRIEGRKEGIQLGIEKGMKRGVERGRMEGIEVEKTETIMRMFKSKFEIPIIAQCVAMTTDAVQRIIEEQMPA